MGHSIHMQRFGKVDSFGHQCMKTPKIMSRDVAHVRDMEISIHEMLWHSLTILRLSSLMSRVLIIWDHLSNQRIANTS
jgi:hypothetical protein